jgi:hypothetical protein
VNTAMNLLVPSDVGKFLSGCKTGGFSRRAHLRGLSYMLLNAISIGFIWLNEKLRAKSLLCPSWGRRRGLTCAVIRKAAYSRTKQMDVFI